MSADHSLAWLAQWDPVPPLAHPSPATLVPALTGTTFAAATDERGRTPLNPAKATTPDPAPALKGRSTKIRIRAPRPRYAASSHPYADRHKFEDPIPDRPNRPNDVPEHKGTCVYFCVHDDGRKCPLKAPFRHKRSTYEEVCAASCFSLRLTYADSFPHSMLSTCEALRESTVCAMLYNRHWD